MSIKIGGSTPFRPAVDQSKRKKVDSGPKFEDSLKENTKVINSRDKVELSSNLQARRPAEAPNPVAQDLKTQAAGVAQTVLSSPEQANSRVEEIKNLIDSGGAKAYFDTVDSEKVAQRLLGSGILDDTI